MGTETGRRGGAGRQAARRSSTSLAVALLAVLGLALPAVSAGNRTATTPGTSPVRGDTLPAGTATISRPVPPHDRAPVESPSTRFITDRSGRVVILRGENVISAAKNEPLHVGGVDEALIARLSDDFGFNVARHLVFWAAIEPERGHFDESYFDRVQQRLDWYGAHGVYVFLDMHQDLYAERFGGDGAPDWAVRTDGNAFIPPAPGLPWWAAAASPAVQASYRHFWDPARGTPGLKRHYLAAMAELVRRFRDHPAVIGYDIMNEPGFSDHDLAGTLGAARTSARTGDWRSPRLIRFTQRLVDTIRAEDPDGYIFYEPSSLNGADLDLGNGISGPFPGDLAPLTDPRPGPARLVYAPHLYSVPVDAGTYDRAHNRYVARWAGLRRPESRAQDSALFIGEFGTGPGLRPWIRDVIDMADRQMLGFTWWSYDAGGWGITNPDGSEAPHARDVARPYPQAVAGVPDAFSYDRVRHAFRLDFHTREGVEGATEIYVGARRHFPDGWQVTVGGSGAPADLSYDARREVLLVDVPQSAEPWAVCITRVGRACPARGTSRG